MKRTTFIHRLKPVVAFASVSLLLPAGAAHAVEFKTEQWSFSVTGNVNTNYTYTACDKNPAVVKGSLLCTAAAGESKGSSSVSSGNLPNGIVFGAKTTQEGYDLAATFGYYPGIVGNDFGRGPNVAINPATGALPSGNIGLASPAQDIRQVFATVGNKDMGTVLIGRNYSPVGFDAIVNDITLIAVGVASSFTARAPANTTLGTIGFGHLYPNPQAQLAYTTPDYEGFKATIGIFQPTDVFSLTGTSASSSNSTKSTPGVQGKLRYDFKGSDLSGFVSSSGLYQKQALNAPGAGATALAESSPKSYVLDFTGKLVYGPFELVAHAYTGTGIGIYAYYFDGFSPTGKPRDSSGGYLQAAYTVGKTKFGANYGISSLDQGSGDTDDTLLKDNSKFTLGVYHSLTKNVTLTSEVTSAKSENHQGGDVKTQNYNVGVFFSF